MADQAQQAVEYRHAGAYPGEAVIQQGAQKMRVPFGELQCFVRQTELEISSRLDAITRMSEIYGTEWTRGVPEESGWFACLLPPAWSPANPDPQPEMVLCEVAPSTLPINKGQLVVHFLARVGAQPLHRLQSSFFRKLPMPQLDLAQFQGVAPAPSA